MTLHHQQAPLDTLELWFSVPIYRTNISADERLSSLSRHVRLLGQATPNGLDYRKGYYDGDEPEAAVTDHEAQAQEQHRERQGGALDQAGGQGGYDQDPGDQPKRSSQVQRGLPRARTMDQGGIARE